MWNNLPLDILANIFSYLSPDSLACAKSACRSWYDVVESVPSPPPNYRRVPWFLAFPTRGINNNKRLSCYMSNPIKHNWHVLPLDFITSPVKPVAAVNGLMLLKLIGRTSLELAVCNPFTRQFRSLPSPAVKRTNPALGSIETAGSAFKIYAAGGMSEAASGGGALYQPTVEVYDSSLDAWRVLGPMPVEFAVRLTVWTSSEGVFSGGVLYWITSARAYSVMGFEVEANRWRELSVPMADRLEFASLVSRRGSLAIVGGTRGGGACVWELSGGGAWCVVEKVPFELGIKVFGDGMSWEGVKCVGYGGAICLYRDVGSGFITWSSDGNGASGRVEEGCYGVEVKNGVKGLLIQPKLSHSFFL